MKKEETKEQLYDVNALITGTISVTLNSKTPESNGNIIKADAIAIWNKFIDDINKLYRNNKLMKTISISTDSIDTTIEPIYERPLVLLCGKSGSGKTTVADILSKPPYNYRVLESYTTRPKRNENETGHIFVSEEEYAHIVANKKVMAADKINGYIYCATEEQVLNSDLYVIDPITAVKVQKAMKKICDRKVIIIYLDVIPEIRGKRLSVRPGITDREIITRSHTEHDWDYIIDIMPDPNNRFVFDGISNDTPSTIAADIDNLVNKIARK